ncbi:MAG: riboflavin synthase [candidate division WOR-3 bacterium]
MFTGIVEEKGKILRIIKGKVQRMEIQSTLQVKPGDSISIQGICLTITDLAENGFSVEAMVQTKGRTTLSNWKTGDYVNLERAIALDGRLGGHIVLGHVDEVARIVRVKGNEYYFQTSNANNRYLIPRGSIAIDGVSLTIGNVSQNIISVFLIPYTLRSTTLGMRRAGDFVNIEYDYLVKIICKS